MKRHPTGNRVFLRDDWRYQQDLPVNLYTGDEVKAIDSTAIASGVPGIVLMKRAAEALLAQIERLRMGESELTVTIFCGAGNNGGDGFLLAKLCRERDITVEVVAVGNLEKVQGDASLALRSMREAGVFPVEWRDFTGRKMSSRLILVDAMLGTGIKGTPRAPFVEAIQWINTSRSVDQSIVIAVDIPSGLSSDSGQVGVDSDGYEYAVKADYTVTFIALKRGLFIARAADYIGELMFSSLGVESSNPHQSAVVLKRLTVSALDRLPERAPSSHKYSKPSVAVIGGDSGMAGAPIMSASAALKLGSGLVRLVTRSEHADAAIYHQPELIVHGVGEPAGNIAALLDQKTGVIVIGPGLGQGQWSQELLRQALTLGISEQMTVVLDADALNLVSKYGELSDMLRQLRSAVLTPHLGEARRLLRATGIEDPGEKALFEDPLAIAFHLAAYYDAQIVLKGAGTLCVAAGGKQGSVCAFGNACLATAGSGDVLSGIIAAALVQIEDSIEAIEFAVALHAASADFWRLVHGPYGFSATDIVPAAMKILNDGTR